ncbi:hypothetical protein AST12_05630 [Staphylococcus succinus]|nr:hypothetical protein AST12_05630 [Staphylococcus succinus]
MYKFLYLSLVCGIISGIGIFLKIPEYPSLALPITIGVLGIITALITIPDKEISGLLKLGGVLINFMPIMGALTVAQ